jgi:hypothetical protein
MPEVSAALSSMLSERTIASRRSIGTGIWGAGSAGCVISSFREQLGFAKS